MQVAPNTLENQVVNHRQAAIGLEEKNKASISLTTQEGDVVTLSFSNQNKYAESASKTETKDGKTAGEFSVSALSASSYSISIQGSLNEEELAAINKLADAITPIAQDFFSQNNSISLEQATQSLSKSLGVIKEAEVRLELSVTQTYSESEISSSKPEDETPRETALTPDQKPSAPQDKDIRNPEALANAVVDSAFQKEGNKTPKGNTVLVSGLSDLIEFLKKQLKEFIDQLNREQDKAPKTPSAVASQSPDKKASEATPPPAPDNALNN